MPPRRHFPSCVSFYLFAILALSFYLHHLEALEDIALLDVVEAFESYAALEALRHLAPVLLEVAERAYLVLEDDDAVSHYADLRVARDGRRSPRSCRRSGRVSSV